MGIVTGDQGHVRIDQQLLASETDLRTAFGNNFEGKMVIMNRGIEELDRRVGGGLKETIKDLELARDAKFVKAMVMVGEMMSEDLGLDKLTGEPSMSAESLDEQMATVQASPAYRTATDPGHEVAVQRVAKLMQMKHGKQAVEPLTRQSFIV